MINIPNTIYLQTGGEDLSDCHDFNELCEVTWSHDPINTGDVKYVRSQNLIFESILKKRNHELPNDHPHDYNLGYVKAMNDIINFIKKGAVSEVKFDNTKK